MVISDPAVKLENLDDLFYSTPFYFDTQLAYRRRVTVAILISGSGWFIFNFGNDLDLSNL